MNATAEALLPELAAGVRAHLAARGRDQALMVGIHTGGAWVAERLHAALEMPAPLGTLNINFYRDDFTRSGLHPRVLPSELPVNVDDRHVVLVDDVLQTGRTIRAALNEIFDYGRPASVTLAVLVERDGREIPVQADVVGRRLQLEPDQYVRVDGPAPLELRIERRG